jgi:hypothetical protein
MAPGERRVQGAPMSHGRTAPDIGKADFLTQCLRRSEAMALIRSLRA